MLYLFPVAVCLSTLIFVYAALIHEYYLYYYDSSITKTVSLRNSNSKKVYTIQYNATITHQAYKMTKKDEKRSQIKISEVSRHKLC